MHERHRRHEADQAKAGVQGDAALHAEGRTKIEVTHDEKEKVFEIVKPLVPNTQLYEVRYVSDWDNHEVDGQCNNRVSHGAYHAAVRETTNCRRPDAVRENERSGDGEDRGSVGRLFR